MPSCPGIPYPLTQDLETPCLNKVFGALIPPNAGEGNWGTVGECGKNTDGSGRCRRRSLKFMRNHNELDSSDILEKVLTPLLRSLSCSTGNPDLSVNISGGSSGCCEVLLSFVS